MGRVRSRWRLGWWILSLCGAALGCGRTNKHGASPEPAAGGAPLTMETPVPGPMPNCAIAIAGKGGRHCAAYKAGGVWCGGNNAWGPRTFEPSAKPQLVEGLTGVQRLVVGPRHSCAEASDGWLC